MPSGLGPLVSTDNARHVCDGRTVSVSRPYHSWLYQFFESAPASRIRSAFPQGHYASAFRALRCHSRAGSRATFSSQIGRHPKIRSGSDDVFHRQVSDEQQRFSRHPLFFERDILELFFPRLVLGADISAARRRSARNLTRSTGQHFVDPNNQRGDMTYADPNRARRRSVRWLSEIDQIPSARGS